MQQKKNSPKTSSTKADSKTKPQVGGREFGNVIEPLQAQMASGNKGLAADFGSSSSGSARKKTPSGRKPAA